MTVTIAGETRVEADPERFPTDTLRATFRCSTGDPIPGEWTGIPVSALLDAAGVPNETTHLQVRGSDGFTACVPVADVLDGVLAFERRPLDDETGARERDVDTDAGLPRFVAPGVSGTRTVKSVVAVEPAHLEPEEDAESFEDLLLEA